MIVLNMDTPTDLVLLKSPTPTLTTTLPPDRHPAQVYLAHLGAGSRRTMREALESIAQLLTNGAASMENLPWPGLRYQHTAAIRAALMERYKPNINWDSV